MIELVTKQGLRFNSSAAVRVGDKSFDMEKLPEEKARFVVWKLQEQMLNAAYAGKAVFKAGELPDAEDFFSDRVARQDVLSARR